MANIMKTVLFDITESPDEDKEYCYEHDMMTSYHLFLSGHAHTIRLCPKCLQDLYETIQPYTDKQYGKI